MSAEVTAVLRAGTGREATAAAAGSVAFAPTLEAAHRAGADVIWLLAPGLIPDPRALDVLLGALDGALAVAGLVVDPAGAPIDGLVPRGRQDDLEALIAAAPARRVPIRYLPPVHALLRSEAIERCGLPDGRYGPHAITEWSLRVLEKRPGWLLPGAPATLVAEPPWSRLAALRDVAPTVRMARTGRWTLGERLRAFRRLGASGWR